MSMQERQARLDARAMNKEHLLWVLANLSHAIPFAHQRPTDQLKSQPFLCGVVYGLGIAMDAGHVPEVIDDERFNNSVMRIIEGAVKNYPKLFKHMLPTGITKSGEVRHFDENGQSVPTQQ